jgi:hypothetical protein
MTDVSIEEWIATTKKASKARRDEQLRAQGGNPFLTLPVGETEVTLQRAVPIVKQNSFGKDQYHFTVEHEKAMKTWTVTVNSPMAEVIIDKLAKAPCKVTIVRSGTGKATRLDIKQ